MMVDVMLAHWQRGLFGAVVIVSAVAVLGGCAGRGAAATSPAQPAAEEPVPAPVDEAARGVVEQYRQAYEVRSLDALLPLYAQSPALVLVRQGRPMVGWEAVHSYLTPLLTQSSEIRLALEDMHIMPLGQDGAVVTARLERTVSQGATATSTEGMLTLVLRRQGDGWVIASEHFSHPPRM